MKFMVDNPKAMFRALSDFTANSNSDDNKGTKRRIATIGILNSC